MEIPIEQPKQDDIYRFGFDKTLNRKGEIINPAFSNSETQNEIYNALMLAGVNIKDSQKGNLFIGYKSGNSSTTGYNNSIIGYQAGVSLTTGYDNSIFGYQAGYNLNSGYRNFIFGYQSGYNLTNGNDNYIFGYQSGYNLTTGDSNTILGYQAGKAITTHNANVFIGNNAGLKSTNNSQVYIGDGAGQNSVGGGSVFIGQNAGNAITSGSGNTLIGASALYQATTGSYNTILGDTITATSVDVSDCVAIGNNISLTANNQCIIGETASANGLNDFYFGKGVTHATPKNITFNVTGGSGTDIAGVDFIIAGGKATGNAEGGDVFIKTSDAGASGTTLQSLTQKFAVTAKGNNVAGALSVLATTATDGFLYIPTCAGTPTGVPTAYTGKVATVYDTTNNKFYNYNGSWRAAESELVVTALAGMGILTTATLVDGTSSSEVNFANGASGQWTVSIKVPKGATSLSAINIIYRNGGGTTGNLYLKIHTWHINTDAASAVEEDSTDTYSGRAATGSAGQYVKYAVPAASFNGLTNIDADDIITINLYRDASNASDTFEAAWTVVGIEFTFA